MNLLELMVTIGVEDGDVENKLKDLSNNLKGTEEEAKQAAGGISAADVAVGNLISSMAQWGVNALKNMAQTGIQYNAQIEGYTAALTTALGSEAAAAAAIEQIKVDAAKTPYSVDGLVSANSYLIQAGESAEDARATILALTDAVSASGGGNAELQRMAQNLQQIKNTGKATAMDIRQFAIAGIDIYGILSDYTGKSTEEVKELEVTYELLTGALEAAAAEGGRFYEANARQAETLNGQLSTLADNWQSTLGNAFSGVSNLLSGTVLPAANAFLESLDPSEATALMIELAAGIGAVGVAALKSSPKVMQLIGSLGGIAKAALPYGLITAAVVGVTAAVIDNVNTMEEYTNSLVNTSGSAEDMADNLEVLRTKEAELKEQMDSGWGSEQTYREYDMVRNAIELQVQAMNEAETAQDSMTQSTEETTAAMENQEAMLKELAQAYFDTYTAAQTEVQGWFGMFQKVGEVEAASLSDMKTNIQSQIDFNKQYEASLQSLVDNGYGQLATQIQSMGQDGAQYALALSEALAQGNSAQVEEISSLLGTLAESENTLAETMTTASGQFDELIKTIEAGTKNPYTITLEDNAAETAEGVNTAIGSIADVTTKYIDIVTRYSEEGASADGYPAYGMDYVPFDGFVASLHKGERILTAAENKEYSQGQAQAMPQEIRVVAPISVQIDGKTIAYETYDTYKQIESDRGGAFVRAKR